MRVQLETDRLLLRPLTMADLDEFMTMHSAPEVARTMGHYSAAGAADRIERNEREWREYGYGLMSLVERETGRFLGRSGLKYWSQFDETEVGWVLHPDFWGRGFATEAARACLDWGFGTLDVPYITAMIVPDNIRSLRVAERLGMVRLRSDTLLEFPVIVHAMERDTWPGSSLPRDPVARS
jgi:RimJ/RimL family protein N-acetyltransferase